MICSKPDPQPGKRATNFAVSKQLETRERRQEGLLLLLNCWLFQSTYLDLQSCSALQIPQRLQARLLVEMRILASTMWTAMGRGWYQGRPVILAGNSVTAAQGKTSLALKGLCMSFNLHLYPLSASSDSFQIPLWKIVDPYLKIERKLSQFMICRWWEAMTQHIHKDCVILVQLACLLSRIQTEDHW